MTVWFTSDTHFGHANIIKYCNRPFQDVEEMDRELVYRWNFVVMTGDIVYHLGDVAMGRLEETLQIVKQLNGQKFLIPGNHDSCSVIHRKHSKKNNVLYESVGFAILNGEVKLSIGQYSDVLLSHYPHYPIRDNVLITLSIHGHTHSKLQLDTAGVHVGVDAWNYTPVSEAIVETCLYKWRKQRIQ